MALRRDQTMMTSGRRARLGMLEMKGARVKKGGSRLSW